jgi:hypothetical protein
LLAPQRVGEAKLIETGVRTLDGNGQWPGLDAEGAHVKAQERG